MHINIAPTVIMLTPIITAVAGLDIKPVISSSTLVIKPLHLSTTLRLIHHLKRDQSHLHHCVVFGRMPIRSSQASACIANGAKLLVKFLYTKVESILFSRLSRFHATFHFPVGCFDPVVQAATGFDLALAHWYSHACFQGQTCFSVGLVKLPKG